jgi:putative PIN family toxin of toxin-antitoxin system
MRLVLDTNLWISGLLWRGLPWRLLQLAEQGVVELCSSPLMLAELAEVLAYPKLAPRLQQLGLTAMELTERAANLATIWETPEVAGPPIVAVDPDDDIFLHCASIAHADTILSGDGHLLDLCQYAGIPIITVRDFFTAAFPELVD